MARSKQRLHVWWTASVSVGEWKARPQATLICMQHFLVFFSPAYWAKNSTPPQKKRLEGLMSNLANTEIRPNFYGLFCMWIEQSAQPDCVLN